VLYFSEDDGGDDCLGKIHDARLEEVKNLGDFHLDENVKVTFYHPQSTE